MKEKKSTTYSQKNAERLAKVLRENLLKRKQQQRQREAEALQPSKK